MLISWKAILTSMYAAGQMSKYLRMIKAERKLEEQHFALLSRQTAQLTSQRKAAIAAAEKDLVSAHMSSRPFSREHRAAGD